LETNELLAAQEIFQQDLVKAFAEKEKVGENDVNLNDKVKNLEIELKTLHAEIEARLAERG
jgi:lipid II:glycine glycyltransferase (peptidoglycan interpeptide bridge formation enzyme)